MDFGAAGPAPGFYQCPGPGLERLAFLSVWAMGATPLLRAGPAGFRPQIPFYNDPRILCPALLLYDEL